jgi:hypothetical protein
MRANFYFRDTDATIQSRGQCLRVGYQGEENKILEA